MNWIKAMTESIDYIEDHLTDDLHIKDIAKVACVSPFYYQRMFTMLTNIPVQSYIRNRRMSKAAIELQSSSIKVIDLAMKYGYDSSEAFTRAFKSVHGATPSLVRKNKSPVKSFLKLTIQLTLKGETPMDVKIITKPGFSFYGLKKNFTTVDGANFREIPVFWQDSMADGSFNNMIKHSTDDSCLGVCMPMNPEVDTDFDYYIGAFSNTKVDGYDFIEVPEQEWAVFELNGPMKETIQPTWKRIFQEWFPQTGFKHADLPEFEVYMGGDVDAADYYMEIWIPINK